jgi:hypothetical protein
MKSCNVFLTFVAVAVIALALGTAVGYDISTGRTTTILSTHTQTLTSYSTITPVGLSTLSKVIVVTEVQYYIAYTSGTCSWVGDIVRVSVGNYTEYLLPEGNETSQHYLNVTVTTVTSTATGFSSASTTTVTLSATSQGSSITCPFSP